MTSIFSNLSNILNLNGQPGALPAGFVGPQQPELQGAPQPTIMQQISANYAKVLDPSALTGNATKLSQEPGFNNALFRLGTTLLAARERGMGLGEGLNAGQSAFNSEVDRAKAQAAQAASARHQAFQDLLLQAQAVKALQPDTSSLQKDFAAAGIDPKTPEGRALMLQAILKPASTVNVNNTQEGAFTKEFGKGRAESVNKTINSANEDSAKVLGARPALARIGALMDSGVNTGSLDETKVGLANIFRGIGLDGSQLDLIKNASSLQEIQGLTNQLVIPTAKQLGVNPTDTDAKRIESTVAGLGNTPEANKRKIQFINELGDITLKKTEYINQLLESGDVQKLDIKATKYQSDLIKELTDKIQKEGSKPTVNGGWSIKFKSK